jgi:hypothetical protein
MPWQQSFELLSLPFAFFAHAKTLVLAQTVWVIKALESCRQLFAAGTAVTVPLTDSDYSFPHSCSVVQVWPYIYYTNWPRARNRTDAEPWDSRPSRSQRKTSRRRKVPFVANHADNTQGRAQESLDKLESVDKIKPRLSTFSSLVLVRVLRFRGLFIPCCRLPRSAAQPRRISTPHLPSIEFA